MTQSIPGDGLAGPLRDARRSLEMTNHDEKSPKKSLRESVLEASLDQTVDSLISIRIFRLKPNS